MMRMVQRASALCWLATTMLAVGSSVWAETPSVTEQAVLPPPGPYLSSRPLLQPSGDVDMPQAMTPPAAFYGYAPASPYSGAMPRQGYYPAPMPYRGVPPNTMPMQQAPNTYYPRPQPWGAPAYVPGPAVGRW